MNKQHWHPTTARHQPADLGHFENKSEINMEAATATGAFVEA